MYLTYDEYLANGGKADSSAFPFLEKLAEKKLEYWTQDRIVNADDDIKLCMTLIVNHMYKIESGEKDAISVSNDGYSVSYASAKSEDEQWNDVHGQVVEILPIELIGTMIQGDTV